MSARQLAIEALKAFVMHGTCADNIDRELGQKAIAALETEIAQEVEPVDCQFQGADGRWHGFINEQHKADTIASGKFLIRDLFTAPQAVNAEMLEACKAIVAWDDAENDATVYAEDGGAHWRMRQALCADAFDKARAAIAKAVKP